MATCARAGTWEMSLRIEDYALIGNTRTAALVGRDGSIDWLCMPRFDSGACFAALLGDRENGRWLLAPRGKIRKVRRHYRESTLVLETEFETSEGVVAISDFMPIQESGEQVDLVRIVEGRKGTVSMRMEAVFRFDYGSIVPWVRRRDHGISAIAGPDALRLRSPVRMFGQDFRTLAEFTVGERQTVPFVLTWYPSHEHEPGHRHPIHMLAETESWWRKWAAQCSIAAGPWRDAVVRSLITLKALTYRPTGGIVAAPTTSLPESLGGSRNWDYRYCWLRDATFTLYALLAAGYTEEARAWREWLLRAVAGEPQKLQIMYGLAGERRLPEMEIPWLKGYEASTPVRIGNAAHAQFQLDVYGEVIDAMHAARAHGIEADADAAEVLKVLMDFLETGWREADNGIWEVRGPRRHFTFSKVMAWVAADRAVKAAERHGLRGPVEKWRALREQIRKDVMARGFNRELNAFVQYYGAQTLDASALLIPLVGFLPASDPHVVGTVEAIERNLMRDGLVMRYGSNSEVDGLAQGEGAFLACSFWYADNLVLMGRYDDARGVFERLLSLRNDVGLLSEEYDPVAGRMLGNFPQAFSHVALVNTAHNLTAVARGPAHTRSTS
jgi:GH15 family glucan-1,4-alpha-glucosidase